MEEESSGSLSRSTEEEESDDDDDDDDDDDEEECNHEFGIDPSMEIHLAIHRRDSASVVRETVERRPELLLLPDKYGRLPIHMAVRTTDHPEQLELVRYLAEQCPASLLVATNDGDPEDGDWLFDGGELPIHLAACPPHRVEVVRCLAQLCPDSVGVTSTHGLLPVERALQVSAPAAVVRELFFRLPDTVSEETKLGMLHKAISFYALSSDWLLDALEIVNDLVAELPGSLRAKRSDSTSTFEKWHDDSTVLHVAVYRTTRENLPLDLVERMVGWMDPATLLERNAAGDLPLHMALFADYPHCVELVRILLRRCPESAQVAGADGILPLHAAITMQKPLLVPSFIELAPECTRAIDSQGRTPMHAVAAIDGSPCHGDVDLLLERWPESLLRRDLNGDLPLHVTADNFSPFYHPMSEVEKMLNRFPETIQMAGANGKLPLHVAVSSGFLFLPLIELLVDRQPTSVKVRDSEGNLPLFLAVQNNYRSISRSTIGFHCCWTHSVKFLVERWPQALLERGTGNMVPLHAAIAKKAFSFRLVEFLVEHCPAALQTSDAGGNLPVHIAVSAEKPIVRLVELLVERCPESLLVRNAGGILPVHIAVSKQDPSVELVEFLVERCPESLQTSDAGGNLPVHIAVTRTARVFDSSRSSSMFARSRSRTATKAGIFRFFAPLRTGMHRWT